MKTRKLLSFVLAAVMLLGCMTVTAFAGLGLDEITLDQTAVTLEVGDTKTLTPTVRFEGDDVTAMHSEYIEWSSTAESVATVENGVVTAVKEGTTIITADCEGFSATCTVTVISGTANLDTDTNKSKDIDQNYTFTQASEEYTDVTKVKLDWTINDIAATYKSHKTWDADKLAWVEAKEDIAVTNEGTSFNITNYSSKDIVANVEFEVEDSLKDTFEKATYTNNNCAVKTPVTRDNNTYQDSDFTALKKTITASLTFNKDKFANLTATSSATKYGTYTVTISEAPTVTWSPLSVKITTTEGEETVNYYPVLGGSNPQPDKFAYSTDGVTFTEIQKTSDVYTMSDVATYAKAGQLYYQGSVNTVRSVNDISWNDTFKSDSASSYPYYASTAYADLQDGIKAKIANDGSETVEKLAMETSGEPVLTPTTINSVSIGDIWYVYKDEDSGFGGYLGEFWSCVAESSDTTYYDSLFDDEEWMGKDIAEQYVTCVLISRTFN